MLSALLAFVLGAALQLQQSALWPAQVYGLLMLPAAVLSCWLAIKTIANQGPTQSLARRWPVLVVVAAAALGLGLTGLRAWNQQQQQLQAALEGQDIELQGLVAAMPLSGPEGQRFRLRVEQAWLGDQAVQLPALLQLGWYGGLQREDNPPLESAQDSLLLNRQPPLLRAGERWRMTVRLKAPHGNRNPHGFDYELWLWEQGVGATGYVRATPKDPPPQRLASTWRYPLEQLRQQVRERIYRQVGDASTAGVLAALAVGDQTAIERSDWELYRATGVAHLMSISGLHITMFAWVAMHLIGALWRRSALWRGSGLARLCLWLAAPTAARLGAVGLALAYALFSGFALPAQRTVLMLASTSALSLLGLRWHWTRIWALACAVVVAFDPWALLSAGFWLSFVAVGVLFAGDHRAGPDDSNTTYLIANNDQNTGAIRSFYLKIRKTLQTLLREQIRISLALAPLTLVLFGQVSVLGLLANLLAIPWVTLLVTPLALAGVLWGGLWSTAALALGWMGQGLQLLASLPWASVSVAAPPRLLAAAAIGGALLAVLHLPWALRLSGVALALPLFWWQPERPANGQFELLAVDVGQGNAVLVRTRGHSLLYDAGPRFSRESDAGHRTLAPLLRALGERPDTLVLSHRDTDHTGGAVAVLQMQPQAALLSSIEPGHGLQALRPATRCEAGQAWQWDGVYFELLHPQASDYAPPLPRPNALSCVLRISNGQQTALLAGDIEAAQEARLVAQAAPLKADVLLVPHHGSKTSSSPAFVQAVQPRWALVQNGYRNRFAHPVPEVVARWQAGGAQVLDSPRCGAATWQSGDPGQLRCEREVARRYWQHGLP